MYNFYEISIKSSYTFYIFYCLNIWLTHYAATRSIKSIKYWPAAATSSSSEYPGSSYLVPFGDPPWLSANRCHTGSRRSDESLPRRLTNDDCVRKTENASRARWFDQMCPPKIHQEALVHNVCITYIHHRQSPVLCSERFTVDCRLPETFSRSTSRTETNARLLVMQRVVENIWDSRVVIPRVCNFWISGKARPGCQGHLVY